MNTLHFKYAVEVERSGSISAAADNLFMSQPNLSKAIKELEDSFGYKIFERTAKGVHPTKLGEEFLNHAKLILQQIDQMHTISEDLQKDIQSLNISIPRGTYIASAITQFAKELDYTKGINLNVFETNSMQIINHIADGFSNLGIIRYNVNFENYFLDYINEKGLESEPIWEFEQVALMSEHHPLANETTVKYEDLEAYTQIVHGDSYVPYFTSSAGEKSDDELHKNSKRICLYERCNQFDLLSNVTNTYMWVSPILEDYLQKYSLVQRRCSVKNHTLKDLLIYKKGFKPDETEKEFISCLFALKNKLMFTEIV